MTKPIIGDTFEETRFYAEQTMPAVPKKAKAKSVPSFHRADVGFSQTLLLSAAFNVVERGERRGKVEGLELHTGTGDRLFLNGHELRQDDLTVLLAIVKAKQGELLCSEGKSFVSFIPRAFVRDVLRWTDSGESVQKLLACLYRLKETYLLIKYKRGGEGTLSFVADYAAKTGEAWKVYVSPKLLELFDAKVTFLALAERLQLDEGLQTWLYGLVNARAWSEGLQMAEVQRLAGDGKEPKKFAHRVKTALAGMQERGLIAGFSTNRGTLTVTRVPRH